MRIILLFIFVLSAYHLLGQNKYICITIDDLPTVTYNTHDPQLEKEITIKLTNTLHAFNIHAIGYVNESKLYMNNTVDSSKIELLRLWLQSGNDLGNHTFSHLDFNKVSDSIYFDNILKGEMITRNLLKEFNKELVYFRHPYLHTGADKSRSKSLERFLTQHHYIASPVTIDNEDYYFARFYTIAYQKNDTSLMSKIGKCYIDYMEKKLIFFEQKSNQVFNRNITQTLLIHASLLNADYLDELATMYLKNGYQFVTQSKALEDKSYQTKNIYYTKNGISWIYRWGFSKGMSESLIDGDIETPEFIIKMSN